MLTWLMVLTLLAPGLLLPAEILEATTHDLVAPALSHLLGRGRRRERQDDALAGLFGLTELPAAALRKLGAGDTASGDWLCLDPVHWRVGSRGVTLDDPAHLAVTADENAALLEAVAPLFADWGALSSSRPGGWELALSQPLALETVPLPAAIGRPVAAECPAGPDGRALRQRVFEAQMLLHAHPVNRRREENGLPTVNSLWVWGQGRLPAAVTHPFSAIWSNDPVLVGLSRLVGIPCRPPPERFEPSGGNTLVVIDSLAAPARSFDALAWREALLAFERDWIEPALDQCASLAVIAQRLVPTPATVTFHWRRSDRLRFWRRPALLSALLR